MSDLPIRDDLRGQQPYGAPTDAVPVRLNVNENPYEPPAAVIAAVAESVRAAAASANRYPDREAVVLRSALAAYVKAPAYPADGGSPAPVTLDWTDVWPANGSNEVMHHILSAFGGPGRRVVSFFPTYSMYPIYARDTFTDYATVPRLRDHSLDWPATERALATRPASIVLAASPNNPTGTPLPATDVTRLHDLIGESGVLVIDEAYQEFSSAPSAVTLLPDHPRLIVTRTMSKALGCAGLRVGYAITSPQIVDALRIVRLPYHLSVITQAAATTAIQHADQLLAPVAEVVAQRERQYDWLVAHGIPVVPSSGNFLYVGPLDDGHKTFRQLLERGVLVREASVPGHLRISIGTPDENEQVRGALTEVLELKSPPTDPTAATRGEQP